MQVSVLEMNGDKVERSLNFIPANRGFYNLVAKGHKMIRCATAEEAYDELQKLATTDIEHIYIKIPSGFKSMSIDNLRIA